MEPFLNCTFVVSQYLGPFYRPKTSLDSSPLILSPTAVTLATVPFIPESPVYLLSRGKPDRAEESLKWLRGGSDVEVDNEIKEARLVTGRKFCSTARKLKFYRVTHLV